MENILIIPVAVFFIAFVFSMFGMGGGLFYMPLFLSFGKNPQMASLSSFSCIFGTTIAAILVYSRHKLIDWRLVKYLGLPLVIMVFLTGLFLKILPVVLIKFILGATLFLAGVSMAIPFKVPDIAKNILKYFQEKFPDKEYSFSPLILSPLTLTIGFLSGISGVAGGVFEIPLMIGILKVDSHRAIASSCAIVLLASILGISGRLVFKGEMA